MDNKQKSKGCEGPGTEKTSHSALACKKCKSETFAIFCFPGAFPLLQCAQCKADISRVSWVPHNWKETGL
jgi:hypothetical protein